MKSIMIVEDDRMLNDGIAFNLQLENYNVISSYNIKQAKEKFNDNKVDLIILDVNLPDGDGFSFCEYIKDISNTPIIFLTACDMEEDIIKGLKIGADDYITKPFSISILTQRVNTVLKRYTNLDNKDTFKIKDLEVDFDKMIVYKDKEMINLSLTEYKILKLMIKNINQVLTKRNIIDEIWGENDFVEEHALTVNINRLRNKLQNNASKPDYIKTIHKIGYMFVGDKNDSN